MSGLLRRLSVQGFKSLHDVDVELGQINCFIGPNGSGKSNLLEALGIASASVFGVIDDESLLRRGVRPGVPALYKSSFRESKLGRVISISIDGHEASYNIGLDNPIQHPEAAWRFNTESLHEGGRRVAGRSPRTKMDAYSGLSGEARARTDESSPLAALLDALRDYGIYTPSTQVLRGIAPDGQPRSPLGLSGGRLAEAFLELQRLDDEEALEPFIELVTWASGVRATHPGALPLSPSVATGKLVLAFADRFMLPSRNTLSGYDASEGALYVLFLAVLALHPATPRLLAVDNIDHGLNPRLARELARRFCEQVLRASPSRQVLATTHNPLMLDGLPLDDDRVRLFVVDRDLSGRTVVRRIDTQIAVLRSTTCPGWTLSRLWTQGMLGGLPDV